jgi:hypothetical protein
MRRVVAAAFLGLFLTSAIRAQTPPVSFPGTYSQNFDVMGQTTTYPPGWEGRKTNAPKPGNLAVLFVNNEAATSTGAVENVGFTGVHPLSDRALGMQASPGFVGAMGAIFTNTTGSTVNSLTISFMTEQYRTGSSNTANETLVFGYQLGGTDVFNGTFIPFSALDVQEILTGSTTSAAVDGNAPANSALVTATLNNLNWANGQNLVIRWLDTFDSGTNALLAIDDISIVAVPEPTIIALAGATVVAVGWYYHRRRAAQLLDKPLRRRCSR